MNIVSILQNSINYVRIQSPLFGKKTVTSSTATIPYKDAETFNVDIWALHLKQALLSAGLTKFSNQKVELILGERFWLFKRIEIPADIQEGAIDVFLKTKINELPEAHSIYVYKFILTENRGKRFALLYALTGPVYESIKTLLSFYEIEIYRIYPEAALVFQLFEHTLNKQKQEPILYLEYNKDASYGLLFDSMGLMNEATYFFPSENIVKELHEINKTHNKTLARLILGGTNSTQIRQDSFTKETGIWTNPLSKITNTSDHSKNALNYNLDPLLFAREVVLLKNAQDLKHEQYALFPPKDKRPMHTVAAPVQFIQPIPSTIPKAEAVSDAAPLPTPTLTQPELTPRPFSSARRLPFSMNKKALSLALLVIVSLSISFFVGCFVFKNTQKKNTTMFAWLAPKPTATPTPRPTPRPTPTPVPTIAREDVVIEIQNGVGTPGLANKVKAALEDQGYTVESVDNAESYDYKTTVVVANSPEIFDLLKADLKEFEVTKPKFEKTTKKTTTLIIGEDFVLP